MMIQLSLRYPHSHMPLESLLPEYFDDLQAYSIEQVQVILVHARQTCKFFPNNAELLEIAHTLFDPTPRLAPPARALQAWNALRSFSGTAYRETALEDPITHHVFEAMGGRTTFGTWNYEQEEGFMRKYFCDLYITYAESEAQWLSKADARAALKKLGLGGFLGTALDDEDRDDARA
jgi:hypothetical protein